MKTRIRTPGRIGTLGTAAAMAGALAIALSAPAPAPAQTPDAPRAAPQDASQPRQAPRMRGPGIEAILTQRARLGLTDQQVTQLNTLRLETLETRQERMAEAARVRSDLAAGEITRAEAAARMQEFRSDAGPEALRARVDQILTEEQRNQLEEMRARSPRGMRGEAGVRGRPGARNQPGMRGEPGARGEPGMRGRPGMRGDQARPGAGGGTPGGQGPRGGQGAR